MFLNSKWMPCAVYIGLVLSGFASMLFLKAPIVGLGLVGIAFLFILFLILYTFFKGRWIALLLNLAAAVITLALIIPNIAGYGQMLTYAITGALITNKIKADESPDYLIQRKSKLHEACPDEIAQYCKELDNDIIDTISCLSTKKKVYSNKSCLKQITTTVRIQVSENGKYKDLAFPPKSKLFFSKAKLTKVYLSNEAIYSGIKCKPGYAWFHGLSNNLKNCDWGQKIYNYKGVDFDLSEGMFFLKEDGSVEQGVLARDTVIDGVEWSSSKPISFDDQNKIYSGVVASNANIGSRSYRSGDRVSIRLNITKGGKKTIADLGLTTLACSIFENKKLQRCEHLVDAEVEMTKSFKDYCTGLSNVGGLSSKIKIGQPCHALRSHFQCEVIRDRGKYPTKIYYTSLPQSIFKKIKNTCLTNNLYYKWIERL